MPAIPAWVLLLVVFLAVYRLTRLVTSDAFPPLAAVRDAVGNRWGADSWQAYLAECPWCVSMYVAGAVVVAMVITIGCPVPVLVWLAASAATGILDTIIDPA